MARITYYHILGVSSDATEEEIASAFRRKVKQWHPDISHHPDAEVRMREINEAAEVLCDPVRRRRYDRALTGKVPFEADTSPRTGTGGQGGYQQIRFLQRIRASIPSIRISPATAKFVLTGFAGLCLLGIMIYAAVLLLPHLAGPPSIRENSGAAPVYPSTAIQDTLRAQEDAGDERYAAGDYAGALRAYEDVIQQNPDSAGRSLWYNRGMALNALGLHKEASDSFDHVLKINPDDSYALAQKGAALLGLGRYEESLIYTDKALSRNSCAAWIWNNRGVALEGLGQEKEARIAFENAGTSLAQSSSELLYRDIILGPGFIPSF